MAFSPNGKYLATGSLDNTVNLIEIESKTIYHKFDKIHDSNNNNNNNIYVHMLIMLYTIISLEFDVNFNPNHLDIN